MRRGAQRPRLGHGHRRGLAARGLRPHPPPARGRAAAARRPTRPRRRRAAERARVARELHDVLAHSLGVVVVQAEAAEEALARRPEVAAESLRSIQRTGREALVEVRRLVGVLREDEAVREPSPRGRCRGGARQNGSAPPGCRSSSTCDGSVDGLPAAPDLAVYRIVQESLTNVLKHAGASRARVLIAREPDRVCGRGHRRRPGRRRAVSTTARGTGCAGCGSGSPRSAAPSPPDRGRDGGFAVRAELRAGGAVVSLVRVLLADDQELVRDGLRHDPRPAGRHRGGRLGRGRGRRRSRRPARSRRTWC